MRRIALAKDFYSGEHMLLMLPSCGKIGGCNYYKANMGLNAFNAQFCFLMPWALCSVGSSCHERAGSLIWASLKSASIVSVLSRHCVVVGPQ